MNTAKFDHKKIILAFSGGLDTTTALHFFVHPRLLLPRAADERHV